MKSKWREFPGFFINGKFDVINDYLEVVNIQGACKYGSEPDLLDQNGEDYPISTCILLARPINDLSDDEIREIQQIPNFSTDHCVQKRIRLEFDANKGKLDGSTIENLLKYGVYPFTQEDFNNDDLKDINNIDIKEDLTLG